MYTTLYKPPRIKEVQSETNPLLVQFILSGGQEQQAYGSPTLLRFLTFVDDPLDYEPPQQLKDQVALHQHYIEEFFEQTDFLADKSLFYRQFKIPKRKGGYRTITAPNELLKSIQTLEKTFLEEGLRLLPHDACHSYTKNRGIKTNAQVHQDSRYFLNLDMKDFFPSHHESFVEKQLLNIRPLIYFPDYVKLLVQLATYEGGLPQGTPLSPLLTNLCCTELDYQLNQRLYQYYLDRTGTKALIHYTRYADDCTFSSVHSFKQADILEIVHQTLMDYDYPYRIHPEKTKFTTHKGKNRVTGLKVNATNDVTVGYEEKRRIKSDIHNLFRDLNENNYPPLEVITRLVGWLAFLKDIEPGYYQFLCNKYTQSESLIQHLNQIMSTYY